MLYNQIFALFAKQTLCAKLQQLIKLNKTEILKYIKIITIKLMRKLKKPDLIALKFIEVLKDGILINQNIIDIITIYNLCFIKNLCNKTYINDTYIFYLNNICYI